MLLCDPSTDVSHTSWKTVSRLSQLSSNIFNIAHIFCILVHRFITMQISYSILQFYLIIIASLSYISISLSLLYPLFDCIPPLFLLLLFAEIGISSCHLLIHLLLIQLCGAMIRDVAHCYCCESFLCWAFLAVCVVFVFSVCCFSFFLVSFCYYCLMGGCWCCCFCIRFRECCQSSCRYIQHTFIRSSQRRLVSPPFLEA